MTVETMMSMPMMSMVLLHRDWVGHMLDHVLLNWDRVRLGHWVRDLDWMRNGIGAILDNVFLHGVGLWNVDDLLIRNVDGVGDGHFHGPVHVDGNFDVFVNWVGHWLLHRDFDVDLLVHWVRLRDVDDLFNGVGLGDVDDFLDGDVDDFLHWDVDNLLDGVGDGDLHGHVLDDGNLVMVDSVVKMMRSHAVMVVMVMVSVSPMAVGSATMAESDVASQSDRSHAGYE